MGWKVNTDLVHWYLDGKEICNVALPQSGNLPMYVEIATGYRGGWPTSMTMSKNYPMNVAYIGVWTP
jgi:hypothetical protein